MIFVTGGTGVLGSHVLLELSKRNLPIRALKRKSSSLTMTKAIFNFYSENFDKIEWVEGDILDAERLDELINGCDVVYHIAGLVSFNKKDFNKLMKINKKGTANIVNLSLKNSIKKLCYVSSTAALGRREENNNYTENNKWSTSSSNSNYAVSKYLGEMEVWRGIEEGLPAVIVNPCVILGAGDWNESSLEIFRTVKNGLRFYSSGANAFVSAKDVSFCMVELMHQNKLNQRYLTIGENMTFRSLINLIADEMNLSRPKYKVKKWMTGLAWRFEKFRSLVLNRAPQITRETAISAMSISNYSNEKVKSALNFQFKPISEVVKEAIAFNNQ